MVDRETFFWTIVFLSFSLGLVLDKIIIAINKLDSTLFSLVEEIRNKK